MHRSHLGAVIANAVGYKESEHMPSNDFERACSVFVLHFLVDYQLILGLTWLVKTLELLLILFSAK